MFRFVSYLCFCSYILKKLYSLTFRVPVTQQLLPDRIRAELNNLVSPRSSNLAQLQPSRPERSTLLLHSRRHSLMLTKPQLLRRIICTMSKNKDQRQPEPHLRTFPRPVLHLRVVRIRSEDPMPRALVLKLERFPIKYKVVIEVEGRNPGRKSAEVHHCISIVYPLP